jgi:hypothetical protein
MKQHFLILMCLFVSAACFVACTGHPGCADPTAVNYDPLADKDCRCCRYTANVYFWHDSDAAVYLASRGIDTLYYYMGGLKIGSAAARNFFRTAPGCYRSGVMETERTMVYSTIGNYHYQVTDRRRDVIWEGSVTVSAHDCFGIKLSKP